MEATAVFITVECLDRLDVGGDSNCELVGVVVVGVIIVLLLMREEEAKRGSSSVRRVAKI